MMARLTPGLLALLLICLISFSGCGYNDIQRMDEDVNDKWAQVENQLKRRADLIPNLVNVVKGYAKHEKDVFTHIADARSKLSGAIQSNNPKNVEKAEGQFNNALSRLLVVVEQYPQLKADSQFSRLMDELAGTENRVTVARMDYNTAVKTYNAYIRQIPQSITASVIGAKPRDYYNPPNKEQLENAPGVSFDEAESTPEPSKSAPQ